MICDCQVKTLMSRVKEGRPLKTLAEETGMSYKTARKYIDTGTLPSQTKCPHDWKTREDPFKNEWPWIEEQLTKDTQCKVKSLFKALQIRYPGKYHDGQLRSFQRRVRAFRLPKMERRSQRIRQVISGGVSSEELSNDLNSMVDESTVERLQEQIVKGSPRSRRRAISVLSCLSGITPVEISKMVNVTPRTVRRYMAIYQSEGIEMLFSFTRKGEKKYEKEDFKNTLFRVLHTPPISFGINRTAWKMADIKSIMDSEGMSASLWTIRKAIKSAGYRWRKAKTVLTSTDPNYQEKLYKIKEILSSLGENDRFCTIDEFGPFAIKMKGGRKLVGPNEYPVIPQFQKSKGWLILTAALELSRNQVTHFYSKKKDTKEMIKLLKNLLNKYKWCNKLYLSWDAASWHASHKLYDKVDEVNVKEYRVVHKTPLVELAPLPASAQFLNVIESVFSGMARTVIHNSNYASVNDAKKAIDRHFRDRNRHFRKHPKRAGKKIWGDELVPSRFSESQNCKDPKWQR